MTRRLLVLVALLLAFAQAIWFCAGSPSCAFEPLFDARIDYGAGAGPRSVFRADLDNDLDLGVANNLGSNVPVLFSCLSTGDCNQDDVVDIGDAVYPIWLMIWMRVFP
jgi:hypothetical protein